MFRTSTFIPYFTPVRTEYVGSSGPIQVAAPNPDRAFISFAGTSGSNLFLDYDMNATSNHYAFIVVGGGTLELFWARHGILTTLAWFWFPIGAGSPLTVTELLWMPGE